MTFKQIDKSKSYRGFPGVSCKKQYIYDTEVCTMGLSEALVRDGKQYTNKTSIYSTLHLPLDLNNIKSIYKRNKNIQTRKIIK